jgi:hypothetical protein
MQRHRYVIMAASIATVFASRGGSHGLGEEARQGPRQRLHHIPDSDSTTQSLHRNGFRR